jgi:hypothetical protein
VREQFVVCFRIAREIQRDFAPRRGTEGDLLRQNCFAAAWWTNDHHDGAAQQSAIVQDVRQTRFVPETGAVGQLLVPVNTLANQRHEVDQCRAERQCPAFLERGNLDQLIDERVDTHYARLDLGQGLRPGDPTAGQPRGGARDDAVRNIYAGVGSQDDPLGIRERHRLRGELPELV